VLVVLVAVVVRGGCPEGQAGTILFDNLNAPLPNGASYVTNTQWGAQAFATSATAFVIDEVSMRLWNQNGTTGGYALQIWDASGTAGSPGVQVGSNLATGLAENLSGDPTGILNVPGLNFVLSPSTTYYLVAVGTGLTDVDPGFGPGPGTLAWNMTDTNPSGAYSYAGGSWAGPTTQNFYMQVTAVPEPSFGIAVMIIGLGTVAWRSRSSVARRGWRAAE
jgi:hypothetical protein